MLSRERKRGCWLRVGLLAVVAVALLALWAPAALAAPPNFAPASPRDNAVGTEPVEPASGDFDEDGNIDLAVTNPSDNDISVLLGNGDGTFDAQTTFPTSDGPLGIVSGDFDGDGNLDLATANFNQNFNADSVSVLFGDGDGAFGPPVDYLVGNRSIDIGAADVDDDGDLDLVTADGGASDNVSVLLNDGSGTFAPAPGSPFTAGDGPVDVTIADFDNDGNLDLATANFRVGTVSVLLGNGDGTFGAPASFAAGADPVDITSADYDGDGNQDLAAANNQSSNVSVLLGNGDGTFDAAVNYPAFGNPRAPLSRDFNGDGNVDLAATTGAPSKVSVFEGNGDGTFDARVNFAVGNGPDGLASADFNNDQKPDLATANFNAATVSILLNAPPLPPGEASISGHVFENDSSTTLGGALVEVCSENSCNTTSTDANGEYEVSELADGDYNVRAFPPSSSNANPGQIGPVTITGGQSLTDQDIILESPEPPPPGTSVNGQPPDQIPVVIVGRPVHLQTPGCEGGTATYEVTGEYGGSISGSMTEGPPGTYTADFSIPFVGPATVTITIDCPDPNDDKTTEFNIYIDPSGFVRDTNGDPIAGASVTLLRSDDESGPFEQVPDGSAIMSPSNRTNPDTTDATGHFGWDVIAGFYKVRAEKNGCLSPSDPSQAFVESEVLTIPPPVTDLDLRLDCAPPPEECTITGTEDDDNLRGTAGEDVICALGGKDTIDGIGGKDTIRGDEGNDRISGGAGADVLLGNAGKDRLSGAGGKDLLSGGVGNDALLGGNSNDRLSGQAGKDVLLSGSGVDELFGGAASDTLNVRDGKPNDLADGGAGGNDRCASDRGDTKRNCEG